MDSKDCLARKRIWEVDCLSMDAVLAASFEWKELANMLTAAGVEVDLMLPDKAIEMHIQSLAHHACHSENYFSLRVEMLLNVLYNDLIAEIEYMEPSSVYQYLWNVDIRNARKLSELFWALGSDPRVEVEGVRRLLHQRFQVSTIRKMRSNVFSL